ncbi:tetraspanin Tsp3 [Metarhizium rileyi]|uniref:Tetraspanin Tsp3 n=1 Tax=Metarhizium rileyi (strain RCEF 4871) TaxID=1649241 RepID=A0A166X4G7_METRR|nr:tetraspanin Tsp3 [Metarhizium rileyi RCEF 4871]TWU74201.1 hypothetical protein ED733_002455 [Metarhizium rileyi]
MPTLAFLLAFLLVALTLFGVALSVELEYRNLFSRPCLLMKDARYEHINSTSLSLPISPAVTIFTVLLPLAAAANALFYPRLARSHLRSNHALAWIFQGAQGIVTTVLATLLFSNLIPSAARDCLLSILWQRFFSSHDAESIRRIQDALNCLRRDVPARHGMHPALENVVTEKLRSKSGDCTFHRTFPDCNFLPMAILHNNSSKNANQTDGVLWYR